MKFGSKILSGVLIAGATLVPAITQVSAAYTSPIVGNTVTSVTSYSTSTSIDSFYKNLNGKTTLTSQNRIDMSGFVNDRFTSDINSDLSFTRNGVSTSVKELGEAIIKKQIVDNQKLMTLFQNTKTESGKRAILNNILLYLTYNFSKNTENMAKSGKNSFDEAKSYLYAFQIIENYAKENGIKMKDGSEFNAIDQLHTNKGLLAKVNNGKGSFRTPWTVFTDWKVKGSNGTNNTFTPGRYDNENNRVNGIVDDNIDQKNEATARQWLNTVNGVYSSNNEIMIAANKHFGNNPGVLLKVQELINKYNYLKRSSSGSNRVDGEGSGDKIDKMVQDTERNKVQNSYNAFIKNGRAKGYSDKEILDLSIKFNGRNSNFTKAIGEILGINNY